jgi:hypothetical protein
MAAARMEKVEGNPCGILGERVGNVVEVPLSGDAYLGDLNVDSEDFLEGLDSPKFKPNVDGSGKDFVDHLLCKLVCSPNCCAL